MQIANPIYDVVFKFLLEDSESAILLLSTIINETIEDLEFFPQENTAYVQSRSLTVYRLDFCARIKTAQGYKQVLIEIQKAKLSSDIMRFRRYLGEQYSKKTNVYTVCEEGETYQRPLPIISIYFLGYALENIKTPVIKVNREYFDVVNQQKIDCTETFIESLTHDSYVIQISQLREQHQTEIEQLLVIFDQRQHLISDEHILEIDETTYPEKYRPLIRRLLRAIAEPEVRKTMDIEDEVLADLQNLERKVEKKDQLLEEQAQKLDEQAQALEKQSQTLVEKDRIIAELKKQMGQGVE